MENRYEQRQVPATLSGFRPADFPLGSIESRAATRIFVEAKRSKEASSSFVVQEKVKDPLIWLQNHTQTKDPHWREAGAKSPYRPFPDKPHFRPVIETYQREPVTFVAKSRDLMLLADCRVFDPCLHDYGRALKSCFNRRPKTRRPS